MITVVFLTIQFSMSFVCTQFKGQTVLFKPEIAPYQVQPLLGSIAMYPRFPKL